MLRTLFQLRGTSWIQSAFVKAPNADVGDNFGHAVAIKTNKTPTAAATCVIAVGAPFEDSNDRGVLADENALDSGAVDAFRLTAAGEATDVAYGKASNIGSLDGFGSALALTVDSLIAGAPFEDSSRAGWNTVGNEAALNSGAVYSLR